jgi:hypothetical protein
MKPKIMLLAALLLGGVLSTYAQFGYPDTKKTDIEKFKDNRLIVVLYADSAYNASVKAAVERFWTFNSGFEFVNDTMMKAYNKPEYAYMMFAKSKKSVKIKAKLGSSEDDFNGLIITTKYRKRAKFLEIIANGFCGNVIDTTDWYPELVRSVQMINNYFNYAIQAKGDKEITPSYMMSNCPGDLQTIYNKKLLVETGKILMKGKEDASFIYGNEVEEVDRDDIYKAILTQDPEVVYVFSVFTEKFCDKIFVSAANSEVMHYVSGGVEDCKCVAKDLKNFKQRIDKANK